VERLHAAAGGEARPLRLDWVEVGLANGASEERKGVVIADFSDVESENGNAEAVARRALELLQGQVGEGDSPEGRLVFLTRNAVAAEPGEVPDPATAPLWGLLRSAEAEQPGSCAIVDLDGSEDAKRQLSAALATTGTEPQLALRGKRALAPRLARADAPSTTAGAPALDPRRTVLLTGAADPLGALIARHLVESHGIRHLLLPCDAAETEAVSELASALEPLGAEARVEPCDPADRERLRALLDSVEQPLGAVVHAARRFDDGIVAGLDGERLGATLQAGAGAAMSLHELTEGAGLTHFLIFSTSASMLGAAGRGSYAAVAAFLDALAVQRSESGLPATVLAWGWTDLAGTADEATRARMRRAGLAPISASRALQLFDAALVREEPLLGTIELDPSALRSLAAEGALPAAMSGLVRSPARRGHLQQTLADRLAVVPEEERPALALGLVRDQIAAVLGHGSGEDVEPDRPFQELGFDSLTAVELRNRLSAAAGLRLPPTLAFDYPTPAALAGYLAEQCAPDGSGSASPEETVDAALAALDEALTAVGAGGGSRERVEMRLRAALAGLSARAPGAGSPEVAAEELAAMSHDEVFALIDKEIGDG
jgi:pimaricinolide synthase PimS1